jgi:hypothetical protein
MREVCTTFLRHLVAIPASTRLHAAQPSLSPLSVYPCKSNWITDLLTTCYLSLVLATRPCSAWHRDGVDMAVGLPGTAYALSE